MSAPSPVRARPPAPASGLASQPRPAPPGEAGADTLVLVSDYHLPTLKAEGEQNVRIAEAFSRHGWTTSLIFPEEAGSDSIAADDPTNYYTVRAQVAFRAVDARYPLMRARVPGRVRYVARGWRMAMRARELAPRLVYTRDPVTAWWLTFSGVPTVYEAMTMPQGIALRAVHGMAGRPALRMVVCITDHLRRDLVRHAGNEGKFVMLPIGVDAEGIASVSIADARRGLGLPEGGAVAVYTGGMRGDRGIEIVLHAARHLPEAAFYLLGGRPDETRRMRALAEELGLRNAQVLDHVPPDRARLYQAAADVLLLPQAPTSPHLRWYTSPAKLFEYWAVGRPLVAADIPCFRELIRDGENALLAEETGEAWAAAVRRLLADPELSARVVGAGRSEVQAYTWDRRVGRIHQVVRGSGAQG